MISQTLQRWALFAALLPLLPPAAASADDATAEVAIAVDAAAHLALKVADDVEAASSDSEEGKVLAVSKAVVREATDYRFRRWLRTRIWDEEDEARYGMTFDDNWEATAAAAPKLPLVVLVHGYNSNPLKNAAVMEPVRKAGYPCATFAYPNDWEINESAARLSQRLKEIAAEHPGQRLAIVTHSMGGLVARACLENAELDPGNVDRLVMIAPPTHGTMLAHIAVATDVWEHWLGRADGGPWDRCRDSVIDGLGEAADDMVPGSPFLTELNARPRNPKVRYAIFLGTSAKVTDGEVKWMRTALQETGGRCPGFRDCTGRVDSLLADMEELVEGKGDGVVALKRGRLDGVDDVVILPFGHLNCTGVCDCEAVEKLQSELLARLK
jgi:pimeloyl-ACP methyl ester carboxylesterase